MRRKILLGAGALVLLAGVVAVIIIGPTNVIGMLRYDIRDKGALKVGDRAPDVELITPEGARVQLASRFGPRPTVLIFGSFT